MSAILADLILPQGIRCDGIQPGPAGDLLQFTDIDEKSPAFRASFNLPVAGITSLALAHKTAAKRAEFRGPTHPLPPVFTRAQRHFVPDGEYRP